jgi:hypothetical protein
MILFSRSLKPDVESCPSVRSLATCSVSLSAKPASTQYYFKVLGLTAAKLWICFVNCFSHYGLERLDRRRRQEPAKRRMLALIEPSMGSLVSTERNGHVRARGIEAVLGLKKYAASSTGKISGQPCQGWSCPPEAVQSAASHQLWGVTGISTVWTGMTAEKASQSYCQTPIVRRRLR